MRILQSLLPVTKPTNLSMFFYKTIFHKHLASVSSDNIRLDPFLLPGNTVRLIKRFKFYHNYTGDVDLVLFCYNNAIQCDPKNIQLHVERVRVLEEKKDQRRLILAKLMLLKYVDISTDLSVYKTFFNQVMSELNSDSDISKKIYVLKNDMKKFQEAFQVENLRQLIELLIKQKQFKEAIGLLMSQCKITISPETAANLNKQSASEQAESTGVDMFQNLNKLEFEIPDSCHNYIRALFIVCLICLDYAYEQVA